MSKRILQKDNSSKALPAVAVVSVTRNRCKPLLRILSQLRELEYPKEMLDIFLVDSASVDDTVERVRQEHPEVNLTESKDNLGIAAGFNTAIKQALNTKRQYKYIWLLDSDVEIEKQTLIPLVTTAEENPEIAVVGSAVFEPEQRERLVTAGLNIDWKTANVAFNIPPNDNIDGIYDVELIPACSSLTRAELYEKQGFWDERLWLYWGDTEWCARSLRNGYRICCNGKSKVWHRNWVKIKPDFYFPYILHDRVRSALIFNLFYNPGNSLAGIRRFILKCYLKAAFEGFTARPNFNRAYDEGIQDFLSGNTSKKDFSSWLDTTNLPNIENITKDLVEKISKKPTIILNQISDKSIKEEIQNAFERNFECIKWKSIRPGKKIQDSSVSERLQEYLFSYLPKLLIKILTFFRRKDVIVSSISAPYLYNTASAIYTLFYDDQLHCYVHKNSLFTSFVIFIKMFKKSIKTALFVLPRALKKCEQLKKGPIGWLKRKE